MGRGGLRERKEGGERGGGERVGRSRVGSKGGGGVEGGQAQECSFGRTRIRVVVKQCN